MKGQPLPIGKIPLELLERLISRINITDRRIVLGPRIGEDATAIDFGDRYLLLKTDPITFVAEDIGYYAVHINANDIAASGGKPKWLLVTLLIPEGFFAEDVERLFNQINQACSSINVSLCGGHTEITYGIDRPIVIGLMAGEVEKEKLVSTGGAKEGDLLILTKGVPLEATSIIAREKHDELLKRTGSDFVERCKNFIYEPGISVIKEAEISMNSGRVHAMHDPTEGGLALALYELSAASSVGVRVYEDSIPVIAEFEKIREYYPLDPLGAISSGSLLISSPSPDAENILNALIASGIKASIIGEVVSREMGLKIKRGDKWFDLPRFERDEIAKLFS